MRECASCAFALSFKLILKMSGNFLFFPCGKLHSTSHIRISCCRANAVKCFLTSSENCAGAARGKVNTNCFFSDLCRWVKLQKKKKNANHKKTLIVSSVVFVSLRRVFCSLFFPSSPRHLAARQLLRCWSHCQPQQRLQRKRKLSQRHCKKRCDMGTRAVEVALLAWSSLPAAGRKSKPPLRFSAGGKVRLPGFEWRKSPCV